MNSGGMAVIDALGMNVRLVQNSEPAFRARVYSDIAKAARRNKFDLPTEMEFIMLCNDVASRLIQTYEDSQDSVNYRMLFMRWTKEFRQLLSDGRFRQ